jgi:hypothetical protein
VSTHHGNKKRANGSAIRTNLAGAPSRGAGYARQFKEKQSKSSSSLVEFWFKFLQLSYFNRLLTEIESNFDQAYLDLVRNSHSFDFGNQVCGFRACADEGRKFLFLDA